MYSFGRRKLIKGLAALGIVSSSGCSNKSESLNLIQKSNTYVLVHGAWHGGWCWRDVETILTLNKHKVYAATLSGLGNRSQLMSKDISLETHIKDISNLIIENDLNDIILVGHSYGGMIITGVIDQLQERVKHAVYLDAVVPENGQSMVTAGPQVSDEILEQTKKSLQNLSKDGIAMEPLPPEAFGVFPDDVSYEWVAQNLKPHPLRTWFDPISLQKRGLTGIKKNYIHCINPALEQSNIPYFAKNAAASGQWTYYELSTGHDAMITAPSELTNILLSI